MGQSFMKWPILPQMRQQRSLGATSPSVSTSGSKKYSCRQNKVTYKVNALQFHHNMFMWLWIPTIWLGYTGGKALTGVPNTVLPLMKAFMMKLVTVGWKGRCEKTRKSIWREIKRAGQRRRDNRGQKTTKDWIIILFLDRPAPRLWFKSNGSVIWTEERKQNFLSHLPYKSSLKTKN